jgi:hypothetical protein
MAKILDKTPENISFWIAFRLVYYYELIDRGNAWATLAHDCKDSFVIQERHNAGKGNNAPQLLTYDAANDLAGRVLRLMLLPAWLLAD